MHEKASTPENTKNARVLIASMRGVKRLASWCSNYEFEDVICAVDDVDLVRLRPGRGFAVREWLARRLTWKPGVRKIAAKMNPGLNPEVVPKDYEVFVFVCMHPSDLIYLSALDGWKTRCKRKVCYMVEFYAGTLKEYAFHLSLLKDFDDVFLSFAGSVETVHKLIDKPVHHSALATDVLRFTPFPKPPERTVDVYSMGRKTETIHRALLGRAGRGDLFYIYDTIPGLMIQPIDHCQHRDLVANIARRSKFFVTFPAKLEDHETRGQSEVGARFFEGAAAGAILIGKAPSGPAFAADFPWPDAVLDTGSSPEEFDAALQPYRENPERLNSLSRTNAVAALRGFDWSYRWKQILEVSGISANAKLAEREDTLRDLASRAEKSI